jgi:hypothetical protein
VKNEGVKVTKKAVEVEKVEAKTYKKKVIKKKVVKATGVRAIIIAAAKRYGVSANTMLNLARCESGFNPKAFRSYKKNPSGGNDRGLYQINSRWHPEVSNTCAYSATCSANWTARMIKQGQLHQWTCGR